MTTDKGSAPSRFGTSRLLPFKAVNFGLETFRRRGLSQSLRKRQDVAQHVVLSIVCKKIQSKHKSFSLKAYLEFCLLRFQLNVL